MMVNPCNHKEQLSFTSSDSHTTMSNHQLTDSPQKPGSQQAGSLHSQTELVCDLINDLVAHACNKIGVQESSCEQCRQNAVEDDNRIHTDNQSNVENARRFQNEDDPQISLEDEVSKAAHHNQSNMENAKRFQSKDVPQVSPRDHLSKDAYHNLNENRPQFYLDDSESLVVTGDGDKDHLDNVTYDNWLKSGAEEETQQTAGNAVEEDCQNRNMLQGEMCSIFKKHKFPIMFSQSAITTTTTARSFRYCIMIKHTCVIYFVTAIVYLSF